MKWKRKLPRNFICPYCHARLKKTAEKCHFCKAYKWHSFLWFDGKGLPNQKGRDPYIFHPRDLDDELLMMKLEIMWMIQEGWDFHHNHHHFVNEEGNIETIKHGYIFDYLNQSWEFRPHLAYDTCGIGYTLNRS